MGITRRNFIKSTIIIVGGIVATPHFTDQELMCGCGCLDCYMQADFMKSLEKIRVEMNRPLKLSSAKRCSSHNQAVSSTGAHGPHTDHGDGGQAVDILISGSDALRLMEVARKYGMSGIGVKQSGKNRFIHLDNLGNATGQPRPWVWSYT